MTANGSNGNGRAARTGPGTATAVLTADEAGLPPGADATAWVTADSANGTWGRDGRRTWRLRPGKETAEWAPMLNAVVDYGPDRRQAPDPDFPDLAATADPDGKTGDALTDFTVRMERGRGLESFEIRRMPTRQAREMQMLDAAGTSAWEGADSSRRGRNLLFEACTALAGKMGRGLDTYYTVTGYHVLPDGRPVFVGGTRGILADGSDAGITVELSAPELGAWTLPDPLGPDEMTAGLREVAALFGTAPGRVIAPGLGGVWRPVLGCWRDPADPDGDDESVPQVNLSGVSGAGKSGVMAALVNCAGAPGVTYNRLPVKAGPSGRGRGTGNSGPGLERLLFKARDLCLPFDDLDPSIPPADARAWQSDLARMIGGQVTRALAEGKSDRLRASRPARCGAMISGEPMDGEDSAVNRMMNVPLDRGTVDIDALAAATTRERRMTRARFGTAIVCEVIADRSAARGMLARFRAARRRMFLDGYPDSGPVRRGAVTAAELLATCDVVAALAVRRGADPGTAAEFTRACEAGMAEAWGRHLGVIERGGRSATFLDLTVDALAAGTANLGNADNPEAPPPNALALGWRVGRMGLEPCGTRIGWAHADGSWRLIPSVSAAVAKRAAESAGTTAPGSERVIGATLKADGMLVSAEHGRPNGAATQLPRALRALGFGARAWHVRADVLPGADADADEHQADEHQADEHQAPTAEPAPAQEPLTEPAASMRWNEPGIDTIAEEVNPPGADADRYSTSSAPAAVRNPADGVRNPRSEHPAREQFLTGLATRIKWDRKQAEFFRQCIDRLDARVADDEAGTDEPDGPRSLRLLYALEGRGARRGERWQPGPFTPCYKTRDPHYPRFQPWPEGQLPVPVMSARVIEAWAWRRDGYHGPADVYDRTGAWMSALSSADFAFGMLEQTGPYDGEGTGAIRPGYYLVTVPEWHETGMPSPFGTMDPGTRTWIPAPKMRLVRDLAHAGRLPDPGAHDQLTGDPCRLTRYAELIRELRAYAIEVHGRDSAAYAAVKHETGMAVRCMLGKLDLESGLPRHVWGDWFNRRTDWAHTTASQSAVTVWRIADECLALAGPELGPLAVGRNTDEIVLPAAARPIVTGSVLPGKDRPPIRLDPLGITLGSFKVKAAEDW